MLPSTLSSYAYPSGHCVPCWDTSECSVLAGHCRLLLPVSTGWLLSVHPGQHFRHEKGRPREARGSSEVTWGLTTPRTPH